VIDNYDSFTYNLCQVSCLLGAQLLVSRYPEAPVSTSSWSGPLQFLLVSVTVTVHLPPSFLPPPPLIARRAF
jgi:hypothetical protein